MACFVLVLASTAWGIRELVAADAPSVLRRPNVLLVSIDSLRADHVGSYGYHRDTSPNIDRLAREGVLFETALSSAPWTVPAHMTMLTALPPEVHEVTDHMRALKPDAVTIAEVFKAAGYETAAFVSGPTVMAYYGFAQGFDLFDESVVETNRARSHVGITSPATTELVDGFLERWDYSGRHEPFFVFMHMWDVHYDYAPPEPYDRMFDPDYGGDLTSADFERNQRIRADMPARDLEHLIALYDGEIRYTDEHLGRIIERLRTLKALDDTIVVVTSDHGDEFFEHGHKGHAKTLYDEVLRVPLVIRYPRRLPFGRRVAEQVRMMDIAPTILGLAGVAAPAGFGFANAEEPYRFTDLTPWIAGLRPRQPFVERPAFSETGGVFGFQWSIRTPGAKLIRYRGRRDGRPSTEVFDLARDPGEARNLFGSGLAHDFLPVLELDLAAWQSTTQQQEKLAMARKPSPQHEARLRALGYLE